MAVLRARREEHYNMNQDEELMKINRQMLLSEEAFLTHFMENKRLMMEAEKELAAAEAKAAEDNMQLSIEEIFAKPLFSNV